MESEPKLVKNIIRAFRSELEVLYPRTEIMQFLYVLFEEYLQWPKTSIHLSYDVKIEEGPYARFQNALSALKKGTPIQYITGNTWFNGIRLKITPDVLIPRPETEELCRLIQSENILDQYLNLAMLDIGTGSGCIAIDLKKKFPFALITAIDTSQEALKLATENALSAKAVIHFALADILDSKSCAGLGTFNIIVSNPPYVTESEKEKMHRNVIDFEPSEALFVPDNDPLIYYHVIAHFAAEHIMHPGALYFEVSELIGKPVQTLLRKYGFLNVEVFKDFFGKDRFVRAHTKPELKDTSYCYADKS